MSDVLAINPGPSVVAADPADRARRFNETWERGGLIYLLTYQDQAFNEASNQLSAEFIREKIRAAVKDPATAEKLCPHYTLGCKRLCVDTNYFDTYNRPNVHLVDINAQPIEEVTPKGIMVGGKEHQVDVIIFATGFDAITGALNRIDIRGVGGKSLKEKWAVAPSTYLGLGVNGFPNLFTITGPGSPSVLSNMVVAIEQHVDWISDCLTHMRSKNLERIEADSAAEAAWLGHVNAVASMVVISKGCNSWYNGSNIAGKPVTYIPLVGFPQYVAKCTECVQNGYQGFHFK